MAGGFKRIYRRDEMKILFIEPYPIEGPSSRYRVEQYIPYLRNNGLECFVRPFVSTRFYKILYNRGCYVKKTLFFLWSAFKRFSDIFIAVNSDIIFIHLEAFPIGPPVFEYLCKRLGKKIIYDLDDAIYMRSSSHANRFLAYLKSPSKIRKIIEISDTVITCNEYLADFARRFNKAVIPIHTSVDTEKFTVAGKTERQKEKVTIGWIGSHSTKPYLEILNDVFAELAKRYRFRLKIIGGGDGYADIPGIEIINLKWCLEGEIGQFQSLDIGVYPLPDNEWVRGKTGFKTIQYMSVGIPCVASGVGANRRIIKDGINGFLAENKEEWVEKLSRLIDDPALRQRLGAAGRKTVEEKFSVKVNAPKYLEIINRYE